MLLAADTLDDLLRKVLERLLKTKRQLDATRGAFREKTGVLLHLRNPRARLSHTETKGKVFSAIGELLWCLAKSDKLSFIEYYVSQYKEESDDGRTIYGAYGPRIFAKSCGHNAARAIDQVENVIALLKTSRTSRRAVIQLFDAVDLGPIPGATASRHTEIPCTLTLQFLLRNGRLNLLVNMRSNDAFLGLPHDVFCFTMLQEIVACRLGVEVGTYKQFVGSLHLYAKHVALAEEYLSEGWQPSSSGEMPPMPRAQLRKSLKIVLRAESRIRNGGVVDASEAEIDPYWQDIIRLLQVYRASKRPVDRTTIAALRRRMHSRVYDLFISSRQRKPETRQAEQQLELGFPSNEKR